MEAVSDSPLERVRDVIALGKPRLSSLVLVTTAGGLWLAPGHLPWGPALCAILATAFIVWAANALNCYIERDSDGLMRRTQTRPLPAKRLEPQLALVLGVAVALVAIPVLGWVTNPLTGWLGAIAFAWYVLFYTPLKKRSTLALVVGAVPGAIPPLMGWTAVTGRIDAGGLGLFALLFVWQLPHFLAISMYLKDDYRRGGLEVFSLVHGERAARVGVIATMALLIPVSLALVPLGVAGWVYGVVATVLGVAFLAWALLTLGRAGRNRWARQVFLGSLAYLTLMFAALVVGAH